MDDILPLTIYVVSQARVRHLSTEFNLLEDFLKVCEAQGSVKSGINFEMEKKILTNFSCGVIYVSKEWPMPKLDE